MSVKTTSYTHVTDTGHKGRHLTRSPRCAPRVAHGSARLAWSTSEETCSPRRATASHDRIADARQSEVIRRPSKCVFCHLCPSKTIRFECAHTYYITDATSTAHVRATSARNRESSPPVLYYCRIVSMRKIYIVYRLKILVLITAVRLCY